MKFPKSILVLLISLAASLPVARAQTPEADTPPPEDKPAGFGILGWTITPGIGVRLLDIDVTDRQSGAAGRATNDGSFSNPIYLSLDIESPTLTFGNFGATVRAHATSLKLNHQRFAEGGQTEEDNIHDVDTEVKASYHYLMPTLFYRWTTASSEDSRLGLGFGKWDASFSGDILLSRDFRDYGSMPTTSINGSVKGENGMLLFWQTRFEKGLLEFSLNEVDFSNSEYKFGLSELNMMFGYYFEL
jgi:hypothetical protein